MPITIDQLGNAIFPKREVFCDNLKQMFPINDNSPYRSTIEGDVLPSDFNMADDAELLDSLAYRLAKIYVEGVPNLLGGRSAVGGIKFKLTEDEKQNLVTFLSRNYPMLYEKMIHEQSQLESQLGGRRRSKRSHRKTRKGKSRKHRSKGRGKSRKH